MLTFIQSSLLGLLLVGIAVCQTEVGEGQQQQANVTQSSSMAPFTIRSRYKLGDWRPHFNYNPAHFAMNHGHKKKEGPAQDPTKKLNIYLARIIQDKHVVCGGIAVKKQAVLTAAACLKDKELSKLTVKVSDGETFTVTNSTAGNDYTIGQSVQQLALLFLNRPMGRWFVKVPPMCMRPVAATDKVEVWSWDNAKELPLKQVSAQLTSDDCKAKLKSTTVEFKDLVDICLPNPKVGPHCEPTFGLPFVSEGRICGINLSGRNCPTESSVEVYLKLFREKRFLRNVIEAIPKDVEEWAI